MNMPTSLLLFKEKLLGKRHNRVHPGHFATQQGTPFYPAGMSAADWSTAASFHLDKKEYPVVSENDLGAPCCVVSPKLLVVVFFTLTDRASTIPSNIRGYQSGTWSQRGTKVNGSHHGDNPPLRPTGIQIATKSYATLQTMAPTNNKTVHQTSFTPYREQPRSTRIVVAYPRPAFSATNRTNTFQPVLINKSKFFKATYRTKIK